MQTGPLLVFVEKQCRFAFRRLRDRLSDRYNGCHLRQTSSAALLCCLGSNLTPAFHLLFGLIRSGNAILGQIRHDTADAELYRLLHDKFHFVALGQRHKQRDSLLRFGIRRVAAYDPAGHGFLLHGFHRAVKIHSGTVTQGNTFADTQTQNTSRVMRVFSGKGQHAVLRLLIDKKSRHNNQITFPILAKKQPFGK